MPSSGWHLPTNCRPLAFDARKAYFNEGSKERQMRNVDIIAELKAGLFLRANMDPVPMFGAVNVQRAEDTFGATGCSILQASKRILDICGDLRGQDHLSMIELAYSGATGDAIFSGLVNSAMLEPFRGVDSTAGWTRPQEVTNFKSNRRLRSKRVEELALLARGQTAEHLQPDFADAESYFAHRFARKFNVDARDLLDQDVDALTVPARLFGNAALSLKKDLIYSRLLANAVLSDGVALFDASTHANLNSSSALSEANLDAGIAAMENLQENDLPVDALAKFLMVPPELTGLARRLNRNMNNPLTIRSESRLSNGLVDPVTGATYGGSATSWFLSAANGPIEFGFIESNRPTLRSYPLTGGQWGVGYSVNFDVGAAAVGHQGIQKNEA